MLFHMQSPEHQHHVHFAEHNKHPTSPVQGAHHSQVPPTLKGGYPGLPVPLGIMTHSPSPHSTSCHQPQLQPPAFCVAPPASVLPGFKNTPSIVDPQTPSACQPPQCIPPTLNMLPAHADVLPTPSAHPHCHHPLHATTTPLCATIPYALPIASHTPCPMHLTCPVCHIPCAHTPWLSCPTCPTVSVAS